MDIKHYDYDLKNEMAEYRQCGEDDLYKFLLYKSTAVENNFDCDRSAYAKSVYHQLWGFDNGINDNFQNIRVGDQAILMGMDTMNSFWTTFAWSLNHWCKADIEREFGLSQVTVQSIKILLENYAALKKIMIANLSQAIFEKFVLFAKLTHTIGNFVLVPKKIMPHTVGTQTFNTARAAKWNDYFDLSLQWLLQNDDPVWHEETVKHYVQMFELQDYVTEKNSIIPLLASHGQIIAGHTNIDSRPQTLNDVESLLDEINNRIIERGKRLHAKLTKAEHVEHTEHTENVERTSQKAKRIFIKNIAFHIIWMTLLLFPTVSLLQLGLLMDTDVPLILLYFLLPVEYGVIVYVAYRLAKRREQIYLLAGDQSRAEQIKIKRVRKIRRKTWIVLAIYYVAVAYVFLTDFDGIIGTSDRLERTIFTYGFVLIFVLSPLVVMYVNYGRKLRCRTCKLFYMLKKERLEKQSEENISIKVINKTKDEDGVVTSTREQHVPGRRVHYKQNYRCKYCRNVHHALYSVEYLSD